MPTTQTTVDTSSPDYRRMQVANAAKRDAAAYLQALMAIAGGGGIAMAAASEISPWLQRMKDPFTQGEQRSPLSIPLSAPNKRKKRKGSVVLDISPSLSPMDAYKTAALKRAGGQPNPHAAAAAIDKLTQATPASPDGIMQSVPGDREMLGMLAGDHAKSYGDVPWFGLGAVPAVGLPLWAGYYGTKNLLKGFRKREARSDADLARQEYERALESSLEDTSPPARTTAAPKRKKKTVVKKVAAQEKEPLDLLIDRFVANTGREPTFSEMYTFGKTAALLKQASEPTLIDRALSFPADVSDFFFGKSRTSGLLSTAAMPMGLALTLGGLAGYNYADSVAKARREAEEARRRQISSRMADNPPLYALPVYEEEDDDKNRIVSNKSIGNVMKRIA